VTAPAAVVIAAGRGTRMRPVSDRWPKPVLPIDGRPVVVTLVHALAAAGCGEIVVVTGHLAEQVEELVAPLPYPVRFARQPEPLGSADAVVRARARPPYVVVAADMLFADGDLARAVAAAGAGVAGALAVRRTPGEGSVRVRDGRVARVVVKDGPTGWTGVPLWVVGEPVHRRLDPLPGRPPHELAAAAQLAVDSGAEVSAILVGRTRGITDPVDLVRENHPYLR
jgi:bifunctional UDP-N-acetylglucosamine pyrophosphorylase/glucosamine-1-phosphate N-acetyltransferase